MQVLLDFWPLFALGALCGAAALRVAQVVLADRRARAAERRSFAQDWQEWEAARPRADWAPEGRTE